MRMVVIVVWCFLICSFFQIDESRYERLDEAKNEKVRNEILRKLDEIKIKKIQACKEEALLRAESFVDSLVANVMNTSEMDTILIPRRPVRPSNDKIDSQRLEQVIVKPFFETIDTTTHE